LAHHKKGPKLSRLLNVEVFTPNKGTYEPQYWLNYVGSKRLMLGKSSMGQNEVLLGTMLGKSSMGQNEVLLGTCCGMHWELDRNKSDGNT